MPRLTARILRAQMVQGRIHVLDLEGVERDLPSASAGAHVDVHLPGGLVRQYSLCGDPAVVNRWRLGVLLELQSRGGSAAMHLLREGDLLELGEPRNLFELDERAERSLLLAGGIGVTPLLAMAYRLHTLGAEFKFHHFVRTGDAAVFRAEIAATPWSNRVQHHADDGSLGEPFDLAKAIAGLGSAGHVYVCGPQGFMAAMLALARAAGVDQDRLHREYFSPASAPSTAGDDQPFHIRVQGFAEAICVPADQTALYCLRKAGFEIASSCEQGVCGSCLITLVDGLADHRDHVLTDAERSAGRTFAPCCSRSLTPFLEVAL